MKEPLTQNGRGLLWQTVRQSRHLYWSVAVFGFFVNLLMLTGPLYILNVYDRVLSSRSVETLVALTLLLAFLYTMMGLLDFVRGRIMGRVGARFQSALDRRVFDASLKDTAMPRAPHISATGLQDVDAVQRLISSPALISLFDLPWVPLFFLGIFVFHPLLGVFALSGAALIVVLALLNQWRLRAPLETAHEAHDAADRIGAHIRAEHQMIKAMGMQGAAFERWQTARDRSLDASLGAADKAGGFTALIKAFRLFLQSALLGLGAYLVLQGQLSAGAMIAASVMMGRALAPIEGLVGQWSVVQRGRAGWAKLATLLDKHAGDAPRMALPKPDAQLTVDQLVVVPPGAKVAAIRFVSFDVAGGQALGVIGPSGAGKSTLALALTGACPIAAGKIWLGDAALDQYDGDVLGRYVGFLPQRVSLFEGTIKENIAGLSQTADDAKVLAATKAAAAHDMIVRLPAGYDTRVSEACGHLSGGEMQRIGLARALYGDPVMVVLDEPNAHLDNAGAAALTHAIATLKANKKIVIVIAHRPAAIDACDMLMAMENGGRVAFGPKEQVLSEMVSNHREIQSSAKQTGGAA